MDMYLACYSQEEIAAAVEIPQKTVGDRIANFSDFGNLAKSAKTLSSHEEIAQVVDVDKGTINRKIESLLQNGNLAKMQQSHAAEQILTGEIPSDMPFTGQILTSRSCSDSNYATLHP